MIRLGNRLPYVELAVALLAAYGVASLRRGTPLGLGLNTRPKLFPQVVTEGRNSECHSQDSDPEEVGHWASGEEWRTEDAQAETQVQTQELKPDVTQTSTLNEGIEVQVQQPEDDASAERRESVENGTGAQAQIVRLKGSGNVNLPQAVLVQKNEELRAQIRRLGKQVAEIYELRKSNVQLDRRVSEEAIYFRKTNELLGRKVLEANELRRTNEELHLQNSRLVQQVRAIPVLMGENEELRTQLHQLEGQLSATMHASMVVQEPQQYQGWPQRDLSGIEQENSNLRGEIDKKNAEILQLRDRVAACLTQLRNGGQDAPGSVPMETGRLFGQGTLRTPRAASWGKRGEARKEKERNPNYDSSGPTGLGFYTD